MINIKSNGYNLCIPQTVRHRSSAKTCSNNCSRYLLVSIASQATFQSFILYLGLLQRNLIPCLWRPEHGESTR